MNKEGKPLNAKSMASKLRQVLLTIATMTALHQCTMELMRPLDSTGRVMSQGGNQGSTLAGPHGVVSTPQGAPFARSHVLIPASSNRAELQRSQRKCALQDPGR
jgi:hypothetical protein